jgi:PadR family transcriptional regulator PadR
MPRKPEIRATRRVRRVLLVLLTGADRLDGWKLKQLTDLTGPGVYSAIDRLEDAGWITGEWEPAASRPRHRYYRLTRSGRAKAIGLLNVKMPAPGRLFGYAVVALDAATGDPGLPTGAQLHPDPGSARRKRDRLAEAGGRYVTCVVMEAEHGDG